MPTLREIRRRLHSVKNIKQITKTMEMVAAVHLRRAQAKAEQSRGYVTHLKNILDNLAASSYTAHPLFDRREVRKTGLIIISADRGLCGSYNANIFASADKFLKRFNPENIELILIGRKALNHYSRKPWKIRKQIAEGSGKIHLNEIKDLSNQLVDWFLNKELDEIWVVYTHYISIFNRRVLREKLLNIEMPKIDKSKPVLDYIYEPNPIEIFDDLLPRYSFTKLLMALNEAYASEQAARVVSMKAAVTNADEMITNLTMVRNKVRQAGITREMIEIISGEQRG